MTDLDALISKFKNMDEVAFEKLYYMYHASIHGVILNIAKNNKVADDLTQDVFIKAWNNAETYDAKKGRFFTWILNIARNTAIDKIRSKSFKQSRANLDAKNFEHIITSHESLDSETDAIGIKDIIKKLTPKRLKIIELLYFKGFTQKEASDHLKIPIGTVKTRSRDSIRELRGMML
ncbi:RNA polymerase sigma factor [Winogradskyella ursingii]|uniref:RNA polymerase sigma factor n=1 Tax=Winogradskyella ursingii TaxID=2686079 RepID=UPI0015C9ECD3|nr:sigma-70 family RNA polymerase sigma factor [Winogradskyella ursingii]